MKNKLAKLKYLPNNFNVLEAGDHVICAISGKKIMLENNFREGANNYPGDFVLEKAFVG